jgi:hypothetical protein
MTTKRKPVAKRYVKPFVPYWQDPVYGAYHFVAVCPWEQFVEYCHRELV